VSSILVRVMVRVSGIEGQNNVKSVFCDILGAQNIAGERSLKIPYGTKAVNGASLEEYPEVHPAGVGVPILVGRWTEETENCDRRKGRGHPLLSGIHQQTEPFFDIWYFPCPPQHLQNSLEKYIVRTKVQQCKRIKTNLQTVGQKNVQHSPLIFDN